MTTHRGTTNRNERGSAKSRRLRRSWVLDAYRSDIEGHCRCYRCGVLLSLETLTVDRIIPGVHGGKYRRDNIRPACGPCNSKVGGALRRKKGTDQ